jgi:uncharacterized protein YndB with AHSA1/START domain
MTYGNSPQDTLMIERSFGAPVELVWRMWTDPEQFKQWYGPDGATIVVAELDVWVGGVRRVCMQVQTPDGPTRMWFTGEHREIIEPALLVYTESMCDEHGNMLAPAEMGMPDGHPPTTEIRVELENLSGRTKMVLTHAGIPSDSPGAAGWAMALDKLAARLDAQAVR